MMQCSIVLFALLVAGFAAIIQVEGAQGPIEPFSIQNRIAGGEYAKVGQFPHQVGVQTHRIGPDGWDVTAFCGGSLISDEYVLTAAHCLHEAVTVDVFLGATNFTGYWTRIVAQKDHLIIHEEYDHANHINDIALVRLFPTTRFTDLIKVINLPRLSQRNSTFENAIGWILGWGRMGDTGKKAVASSSLKYARRWILPNEFCAYHYPGIYKPEIQICVDGSHGISACPGDSGGPVFIEDENGSRTVVGIASYERYEGCEKNFPVVYVRVTAYIDWIVAKTNIKLREYI